MDGCITVITGTIGTILTFTNIVITTGNLINIGGTHLIGGHM
jgi:hypothetical protein